VCKHVAVAHLAERKSHIRFGEQHVFRARHLGQFTAGRDVIGVQMRVHDVANAHAGLFGRAKIRSQIAEGIDNSSERLAATAEHIGRRDRIGVQELA
jgi:hypothetical protein